MKTTRSLVRPYSIILTIFMTLLGHTHFASAQEQKPLPVPKATASESPNADAGERVNVDKIKERYWAQGEQSEMSVVQNRQYSKSGNFEIGAFGGIVASDPFLSVKNAGFSLGYNFSEYFLVRALGFKDFVNNSSALDTLQESGKAANTNKPSSYYGGEMQGSFLYGKLSFMGEKIIYYDMHLLGGVGSTQTQNGNYITPHAGLGQQVYLTQHLSITVDYRLMYFKETIKEEVITSQLGQTIGHRSNFSNVINAGVTFQFGGSN